MLILFAAFAQMGKIFSDFLKKNHQNPKNDRLITETSGTSLVP